ncbi:TPA: hypothetical protein DCX16_04405 [bacterium]|nr:hypothetical protein [bacterium]
MEQETEKLLNLIYDIYCKYDHIHEITSEVKGSLRTHYETESCLLIPNESFEPIMPCSLYKENEEILHCFERDGLKEGFLLAKKGESPDIIPEENAIYRLISPLLNSNRKVIAILNLESKDKELLLGIKRNILRHIELTVSINRSSLEKWKSLMDISRKLTSSITDVPSLMKEVAHGTVEDLEAEACSLFLVSKDNPEYLELAYEYGCSLDKKKEVKIKISSLEKAGLTAYVAASREILSLDKEEIKKHPNWDGESHRDYLQSHITSWLGVPIIGSNDELLGVIKVENKKGTRGSEIIKFSDEDRVYLSILASNIASCLEIADYIEEKDKISKMQSTYYYATSHSLKTPLHGLLESIRQLSEISKEFNDERLNKILTFIKEDCYKYDRLVKNICYSIRKDIGTPLIIPKDVIYNEIKGMMERLKTRFSIRIEKENINFEYKFVNISTKDYVYMDRDAVEDVLINLVANAINAIRGRVPREKSKGAVIKISIEKKDGKIFFSVRDDGEGIEQDLFSMPPSHPGRLGLGLRVTKEIIFAHKGEISSKPLDKGTEIEFWLPKEGE